ncbi:MAG: hypothetical protein ABH821_02840 [archaeon]
MDGERTNKVYNLFERVTGKELNMKKYVHRLLLQKIVYLVQVMGFNFNYNYGWYIKGPYCTRLASESFEFFENNLIQKKSRFSEKEEKIIKKLKQLFQEEIKSEEDMELLGSLVFVKRDMQEKEKSQITRKLHSLKPLFEQKNIDKMFDKIEESKLFN